MLTESHPLWHCVSMVVKFTSLEPHLSVNLNLDSYFLLWIHSVRKYMYVFFILINGSKFRINSKLELNIGIHEVSVLALGLIAH